MASNLTFDFSWRLMPPADGQYTQTAIPEEAVNDFFSFVQITARRGDAETIYWIFKREFSLARGETRIHSSNLYFAEFDAKYEMQETRGNAPVFIDAFYSACDYVREKVGSANVPSVDVINQLLAKHNIGYIIEPPELRLRGNVSLVAVQPTSVLAKAREEFQAAIPRSEQLLRDNKGDEAVSQIWWLLESIASAFSGKVMNGTVITGDYFNDVMKSIKRAADGTLVADIARWAMDLQNKLSDPEAGGIRHGRQLHLAAMDIHEAELFCNLTRSFIVYLLAEFEKITA